jgi:hypothetical protein
MTVRSLEVTLQPCFLNCCVQHTSMVAIRTCAGNSNCTTVIIPDLFIHHTLLVQPTISSNQDQSTTLHHTPLSGWLSGSYSRAVFLSLSDATDPLLNLGAVDPLLRIILYIFIKHNRLIKI